MRLCRYMSVLVCASSIGHAVLAGRTKARWRVIQKPRGEQGPRGGQQLGRAEERTKARWRKGQWDGWLAQEGQWPDSIAKILA